LLLLLNKAQGLLQLGLDPTAAFLLLPVPARELRDALLRGSGLPAARGLDLAAGHLDALGRRGTLKSRRHAGEGLAGPGCPRHVVRFGGQGRQRLAADVLSGLLIARFVPVKRGEN
jgi:hypothetical protein